MRRPASEVPKNRLHGDFSSNIALTLKKATGLNDSREIANIILKRLLTGDSLVTNVEIAGPGFINITLDARLLASVDVASAGAGMTRSGYLAEGARRMMTTKPAGREQVRHAAKKRPKGRIAR